MRRIITIPVQTIFGILLMALLAFHASIAMLWLFFIGLVLIGSIFGTKSEKRRTVDSNHPVARNTSSDSLD